MIRHVYVEDDVAEHPRTRALLQRFPDACVTRCARYGEVFNPAAQNFRLQKSNPALILARKHDGHVLGAPPGYGIGGEHNFYFSHMLNCVYDCRYCFLQGMFRSANYVVFVNYEDFASAIERTLAEHPGADCWFFSGYDCDSLAHEPLTGFAHWCLPFFAERERAFLELRTKSTQIRGLLNRDPLPNVVVAFSFTPGSSHQALEHRVPTIDKRIAALRQLAERGWQIGLRFDPLIYTSDFRVAYTALFEDVFEALAPERIHSVSYGAFRLPRGFHKRLVALYPEETLFAGPLATRDGLTGYRADLEQQLLDFCATTLPRYVPDARLMPCTP